MSTNILIAAYAFQANRGSEPQVGWDWSLAAAALDSVMVLTDECNRPVVDTSSLRESLQVEFVSAGWIAGSLAQHGGRLQYLHYLSWCRMARRRAKELHRQESFSVAHHLTYGSDWLPSPLRSLPRGVRFIWGPVGGSNYPPIRFLRYLPASAASREAVRACATRTVRLFAARSTARRADLVLVQNPAGLQTLARYANEIEVHPSVVVETVAHPGVSWQERPLHAVMLGRLLPLKGIEIALRALTDTAAAEWTLTLVGDGPHEHWRRRITALGLDNRVRLSPRVSRNDALEHLKNAKCLLIPSLRDSAPWVAAEAAAYGLPVITFPTGGAAALAGPLAVMLPTIGDPVVALANALGGLQEPAGESPDWSASRLAPLLQRLYHSS